MTIDGSSHGKFQGIEPKNITGFIQWQSAYLVPLTAENELMPRQQAEILVPFGELKSPANALCASLRETKFLGPTRLGFGKKN